ncbi:MAG: hypothetical protein MUO84_01920 [Thermoplasmata archaeon]|nr:hypothetical protein [Thermoplasmata archaeon]
MGDGAMPVDKGTRRVFLLVTAICISMFVVANLLEWRVVSDYYQGRGEASTSDDQKMMLAIYELDAGDSIYYEYEASEACWFVIYTVDGTDPLDIKIDERLNLSGIQNAGSFECPVDGRYYLRVTFLGTLPEGMATIDYYTHALNDSSILKMVAETAILAALTTILAYFAFSDYRRGHGGLLYKGLGAAGGISATALSVVPYLRPTVFDGDIYFEVLSLFPGVLVTLCFWVGLFTIAREEEGEAVIQIGNTSLSLVKVAAVVTAIALACGILTMIYVFSS